MRGAALHASAFVSIRQHSSAFVSYLCVDSVQYTYARCSPAYVGIRQHTSAYVSYLYVYSMQYTYARVFKGAGGSEVYEALSY